MGLENTIRHGYVSIIFRAGYKVVISSPFTYYYLLLGSLSRDRDCCFGRDLYHLSKVIVSCLISFRNDYDFSKSGGEIVLDYGCGTGVLSMVAALVGAKHVVSVDVDPDALMCTKRNLNLNSIEESKVTLCSPGELSTIQSAASVDICVANILLNEQVLLDFNLLTAVDSLLYCGYIVHWNGKGHILIYINVHLPISIA